MALDTERHEEGDSRFLAWRESVREQVLSASSKVQGSAQEIASGLASRIERLPIPEPVRAHVRKFGPDGRWPKTLAAWFYRQPIVKFISVSLLRRILASNLIGFVILFVGILYLSFDSSWIINAKRESLLTQGRIIAAAIAANAMVKKGDIVVDPDRLPTSDNTLVPLRDDGFASLRLSIRPERVAPIFRRLIEPTDTRARIYDRRGNLVVNSTDILRAGALPTFDDLTGTDNEPESAEERPKTKDFWTRLQHWLIGREVQVYKEIGNANGSAYPEVRRALAGQDAAMLLLNKKGEQIVSVAVPITRFNKVLGVLLLSTPPGQIDEVLADSRNGIWPLALVALAASLATGIILARTVAGPMRRLSATAERVSRDITAQTTLPEYAGRDDEVGQMARAFAAMTRSLYERIEASEKFAADVAHELKNPLTAASSIAQSLEYARTDEDREQLVQQIQQELKRLNRLINDVSRASMLNAQLQLETPEPVHLEAVLDGVISMFAEKAEESGVKLEYSRWGEDSEIVVAGNDGRLGQVFTNLIDNALSFSPKGSRVKVRSWMDIYDVVVTVEDDGPGIQAEMLETIFSRFYTYRPSDTASRGNNSGLGLSISREIIQSHNGNIWAENRVSRDGKEDKPAGSRFIVRLPLMKQTTARGASRTRRS
jgi:two-component system, OmpR family, sensor histidine kinase ChvG